MKTIWNISLVMFMIPVLIISCDEFIEKNIENKKVQIISPKDSSIFTNNEIGIIWEYMDGANEYHLQLVEPSFDRVQRLLIDTMLSDNNCTLNIVSGDYEIRIRAWNGYYCTGFSYRFFSVNPSINDKLVKLMNPIDDL